MPRNPKNKAVSRTLLVAAIAGGLWALADPGAGLANPGMGGMGGGEDHHRQPQTQPRPQGRDGCGGCGGGSGSRPSADELRDARDRAGRAAQGDGDGGDFTIGSGGGRRSEGLSGQIAAVGQAKQAAEAEYNARRARDLEALNSSDFLRQEQQRRQAEADAQAATALAGQAEAAGYAAVHGRSTGPGGRASQVALARVLKPNLGVR